MKLSPFLERRQRALSIIVAADAPIASLKLPGVRVKGTTNGSQGVTTNGRRARRSKQRGLRDLGQTAAKALKLKALLTKHGALVVRIGRVAPNRLDGDNLEASFKRVRDGLAKCIGLDDRSPLVEYVPDDQRGAVREYAVHFEVFAQAACGYCGTVNGASGGWCCLPAQVTLDEAIERARTPTPTPNVKKPRVTR